MNNKTQMDLQHLLKKNTMQVGCDYREFKPQFVDRLERPW